MNLKSLLSSGVPALAVGLVVACSMGPSTGTSADRNTITAEELQESNSSTVYDALALLRPSWLTSRGPVSMSDSQESRPNVYMHGTRVGDLDYLRTVYVIDVEELRYYPPGEAGARFGMGNPRGVIEIIPRR